MINQGRLVKNFIEARSAKALRVLMIKTNIKSGAENQYTDISSYIKNDKLVWIAWYLTNFNLKDLESAD